MEERGGEERGAAGSSVEDGDGAQMHAGGDPNPNPYPNPNPNPNPNPDAGGERGAPEEEGGEQAPRVAR